MTTPSNFGTFRGVPVQRLERLLERACNAGGVVMMKSVNTTQNIGKVPHQVLAEFLILALREEEQGAMYDD